MKRSLSILLALLISVMSLTACSNRQANTPEPDSSNINVTSADVTLSDTASPLVGGDSSDLITQLRAQYSENEQYVYTEPLYNLPRNFQFKFQGEFFKDDWVGNKGIYSIDDAIKIYASTNFDSITEIGCFSSEDTELGEVTVYPFTSAFDLETGATGEYVSEKDGINDWGNASKYYIVRYIDLDTGDSLEKPIVTLFTVKAELDAPQMKYRTDEYGRGWFYWEPIPGATSYIIGRVYVENGDARSVRFWQLDVVTGNEWTKFGDTLYTVRDANSAYSDTPDWYANSADVQNVDYRDSETYVHDDEGFFVIAVNDEGNSNMSNIITYQEFAPQTPYRPYCDLDYKWNDGDGTLVMKWSSHSMRVDSVESAPLYQAIEMMDGSVRHFLIEYPDSEAGVENIEYGEQRIVTATNGTLFKNGIIIEDAGGRSMSEVLQYLKQRELEAGRTGFNDTDFPVNDMPSVDIDFGNNDSDVVINNETGTEPPDISLPNDMESFSIYANSALSAYLAICMLNHVEEIPLTGFTEAADGAVLTDAFYEAYFQNNGYIGGVEWPSVVYDFETRTLYPDYVLTAEEQKKLQNEINAKADEIVAKIITPGMSDYEKEEAINDYLCANAEYDWDALDDMMSMPEWQAISPKYKYSQTAYGILINNKGICQSYAEAFRVLADKAGLSSVVIVGVLNGMGGHAWNRVLIDDQWFTLDVTNNNSDEFFNEFFNMPDDIAAVFVTEYDIYALNSELYQFTATSYGYDYYSRNGMSTDVRGLEQYLSDNLENGKSFDVVVTDILDASSSDFFEAMQNAANKANVNFKQRIALWVLRIACD